MSGTSDSHISAANAITQTPSGTALSATTTQGEFPNHTRTPPAPASHFAPVPQCRNGDRIPSTVAVLEARSADYAYAASFFSLFSYPAKGDRQASILGQMRPSLYWCHYVYFHTNQ